MTLQNDLPCNGIVSLRVFVVQFNIRFIDLLNKPKHLQTRNCAGFVYMNELKSGAVTQLPAVRLCQCKIQPACRFSPAEMRTCNNHGVNQSTPNYKITQLQTKPIIFFRKSWWEPLIQSTIQKCKHYAIYFNMATVYIFWKNRFATSTLKCNCL